MTDFSIRDVVIIDGQPSRAGSVLLATFKLVTDLLRVEGCVLFYSKTGELMVGGPTGKTKTDNHIHVAFTSKEFRAEVLERMMDVYEAMTGRELEGSGEVTA